jgi:hypothetical protein
MKIRTKLMLMIIGLNLAGSGILAVTILRISQKKISGQVKSGSREMMTGGMEVMETSQTRVLQTRAFRGSFVLCPEITGGLIFSTGFRVLLKPG